MNPAEAVRAAERLWQEAFAPLMQGWIAQEQAQERYQQRLRAYLAQPIGALVPQSPPRHDSEAWTPSIHNCRNLLRRLAGLTGHADPRRQHHDEWSGSKEGGVGMRTCRPAQWDNAIRALEEDR